MQMPAANATPALNLARNRFGLNRSVL